MLQKAPRIQKPFLAPSPVNVTLKTLKVKPEGENPRNILSPVDAHSSALTEIMKRQNEITEMLGKQQTIIPVIYSNP